MVTQGEVSLNSFLFAMIFCTLLVSRDEDVMMVHVCTRSLLILREMRNGFPFVTMEGVQVRDLLLLIGVFITVLPSLFAACR